MKKLKNYFKAFTLVELIIVITILAILATIAFISFQNFTSNARDGNRISTLTSIEKGLNLVQIKTGKYPQPDGEILTGALNLGGSELVYSSMGIIDENISRLIKMNTIPLDPVSNSKYVYAVNDKQDKYQIATLLESLEANTKLPLIEQTYANENYKAKVVGNHQVNVKVPKDDKIWLTTVPSMIFNPEGGNILNNDSTYHIINGGQNLPYKTNDKTITTKETGDKIIQHIRKSQDAKIITVDITPIITASKEEKQQKIQDIFGTGNTQESKELLASIGAITGSEETINTTILTQTVESIITGGSVGSASSYTAPKTPATCGTANKTYENTANSFGTDTFCDVGTLDGENPTFPSQGNSVNWTCISPDGGANASCSATKLNPNEEVKECSGKPANSKYYNGSDTHSVTVNFGSSAPTPNYAETPSENSCDFSCDAGFTHESGACNDITPPTGGSFTINNNAETTNTTAVTLNIICPTDVSSPVEVAFGNTTNPTNWETCTTTKSHTLTSGDGTKTVYMRFRDSVGNVTSDVSDGISLSTCSIFLPLNGGGTICGDNISNISNLNFTSLPSFTVTTSIGTVLSTETCKTNTNCVYIGNGYIVAPATTHINTNSYTHADVKTFCDNYSLLGLGINTWKTYHNTGGKGNSILASKIYMYSSGEWSANPELAKTWYSEPEFYGRDGTDRWGAGYDLINKTQHWTCTWCGGYTQGVNATLVTNKWERRCVYKY